MTLFMGILGGVLLLVIVLVAWAYLNDPKDIQDEAAAEAERASPQERAQSRAENTRSTQTMIEEQSKAETDSDDSSE
jgi:predicted metalloprotease